MSEHVEEGAEIILSDAEIEAIQTRMMQIADRYSRLYDQSSVGEASFLFDALDELGYDKNKLSIDLVNALADYEAQLWDQYEN